jgi:hypothetical protein
MRGDAREVVGYVTFRFVGSPGTAWTVMLHASEQAGLVRPVVGRRRGAVREPRPASIA